MPIAMGFAVASGFGVIFEAHSLVGRRQFTRDGSDLGSGAVADDDDFDVGDGLLENASHRKSERLVMIVRRNDHQHAGPAGEWVDLVQ